MNLAFLILLIVCVDFEDIVVLDSKADISLLMCVYLQIFFIAEALEQESTC